MWISCISFFGRPVYRKRTAAGWRAEVGANALIRRAGAAASGRCNRRTYLEEQGGYDEADPVGTATARRFHGVRLVISSNATPLHRPQESRSCLASDRAIKRRCSKSDLP